MKKFISLFLVLALITGASAVAYATPVTPVTPPPVTEVKPIESVRPANVTLENIKELSKTEKAVELGLSALELEKQGKTEEANKFWVLWQQENKSASGTTTANPLTPPSQPPLIQQPQNQASPAQQAEIQNLMTQINVLSEQLAKAKETGDKNAYNKLSAEVNKLQAKLNGLIKPNNNKNPITPQPPVVKVPVTPIPQKEVIIKEEAKINLKEIEKYAKSSTATLFKLFRQLADRYNNLVNKYNDLQKKLLEKDRQIKELEIKLQNIESDEDEPTLDKLFDNTNKGK